MTTANVRLACCHCDRSDFDGITPEDLEAAKAAGWTGIEQVQSYEDSMRTYDPPSSAPPGYDAMAWWTHLAVCPECGKE